MSLLHDSLVLALRDLRELDGLKVEEWERNAELTDQSLALETDVRIIQQGVIVVLCVHREGSLTYSIFFYSTGAQ